MHLRNQLDSETSPYLLQHKNNPVHWLPWNDAALSLARELDRPILLSIGYASCHWCHVMAHESFEDPDTAKVMNELFINIKVDREERPDLDKIYQTAHSLLTERSGGWPLTVFLAPDTRMPIFAGTYFPATPRHGLPAFKDLLHYISDAWNNRKHDIEQQTQALQATLDRIYDSSSPVAEQLDYSPVDVARSELEQHFDPVNGGFGKAPKFPHPTTLQFALYRWRSGSRRGHQDPQLLHYAMFTLEQMAGGGIFDHIGGGFCRYSTDDQWMIPHFEKMLYDNGALLDLYTQAYQIHPEPLFKTAITQTVAWALREMQHDEGGFYSAQDADSEGSEGKFFVWSRPEIERVLEIAASHHGITTPVIEAFTRKYGLDRAANFEGRWHFHIYCSTAQALADSSLDVEDVEQQFERIKDEFFSQREARVHPDTDTKSLVSWNSLMIRALARTGRLLDDAGSISAAYQATMFIKTRCWTNNRLAGCYSNGQARPLAYLDDYAYLIDALLELLQSRWDGTLFNWMLELADTLISLFEDPEHGAFFFTAKDHESLIQKIKPFSDDAMPSGNAIACRSLNRLGYLTGNTRYLEASERCLRSAWNNIRHSPLSHCALLIALSEFLDPPDIFIVRKQGNDADNEKWLTIERQFCLHDALLFIIDASDMLPDSLAGKSASNHTVAYPCRGNQCFDRLDSATDFEQYLRNNSYRVLE